MNLKIVRIIKMKSLTILCILILLVIETVSCRPSDRNRPTVSRAEAEDILTQLHDLEPVEDRRILKCYEDDDLMELCQRCAKATKVRHAFPMCCSNEENVRDWCREYVYYGKQT
ncbi:uncharacterized protein LOC129802981 [Phlebotomus papatasi]|uniref:Uncharacterized protein n=1 Tax=Phlebotomus papatasi TaxID=29031 RepID=A0A1B0GMP7_PHLPP|nr:uncharacterized protein LOC129802981 [Phlebotomus papatasi]